MDDYDDDASQCPACEGTGTVLGALGTCLYWRCRHCGMQWSTLNPDAEPPLGE